MKTFKTYTLNLKQWKRRLPLFAGGVLFLFFCFFLLLFHTPAPQKALRTSLPYVTADGNTSVLSEIKARFFSALHTLFPFSFDQPLSAVATEVPMIAHAQMVSAAFPTSKTDAPKEASPLPSVQPEIPEENKAPIKEVDLSAPANKKGSVALGNETSYSIDIAQMLSSSLPFSLSGEGPKVLVIHTHATESYAPQGSTFYDITARDRSENADENVVAVGKVLCDLLNQKGIEAVHDTTLHDVPSFNGSYAHSLTSMEAYLAKYPSIKIIFDLHRDSIVYDDNTKAKPVTYINGKPAAQLMFVVGTDEKGLYHPAWRQNLTSALQFQHAINARYPALMRHVNLRQERFNGHTAPGAMIIEVGSSGNSLSEATYAITLAAECIIDLLQ